VKVSEAEEIAKLITPQLASAVLAFGVGPFVARFLLHERLTGLRFRREVLINIGAALFMGIVSPMLATSSPETVFGVGILLVILAAMKEQK